MDEKTFKEIKAEFQSSYFKYIKPNLDQFEEKRIKKLRIFNFIVVPICAAITIFLLLILFKVSSGGKVDLNAFGLVLFPIPVAGVAYRVLEKGIEKEIKVAFMPMVCKCFKKLIWINGYSNNPSEFHQIGLVNYYNDESFDDVFYGNYKNVNFEIIEAKFVYETHNGKNRSRRTVFEGVILKLHMPKNFDSHTVIRPDALLKMPIKNLKRTELEDVVFEKKYDVYTNNEVEARVAITTAFMERLNNIEKVFSAKKVSCCFLGNKAYFGLDTRRDMFKICSLKKPINTPEHFVKMFEEMIAVYRLIEHLKMTKEVSQ